MHLRVVLEGTEKQERSPFDLFRIKTIKAKNFEVKIEGGSWDRIKSCQVVITLECLRMLERSYKWVPHEKHDDQLLSHSLTTNVTEEPPAKLVWKLNQYTAIVGLRTTLKTNKTLAGFSKEEQPIMRFVLSIIDSNNHLVSKQYHIFGLVSSGSNEENISRFHSYIEKINDNIRRIISERQNLDSEEYKRRISQELNSIGEEAQSEELLESSLEPPYEKLI